MKNLLAALLFFIPGCLLAQDAWKNIYSRHAWAERDKWQRARELIRMLKISEGSHVADVGCHEGYMTFKLATVVGTAGIVYAVDVEQGKLERVRKHAIEKNLVQVRPIRAELNNPNLPANTLDAVIILDTYHEMDAHAEILQHINASLKRGGRLLICEPIADERKPLSREEQERKHELALGFALDDLRKAGIQIVYQEENFIDRRKEKGDKMWVVVGEKI